MRGELRQLVETDQRDLSALPVVKNGAFELQMRKLDLAGAGPAPLVHSDVRSTADPPIEVEALIPQRSGIGDLGRRAPEEDGGEVRDPADVAQRLQD
jgi:hypothetical protein